MRILQHGFIVKLQKCFEDYEASPSFPSALGVNGSWVHFHFEVNLYFNGSYSRSRFLKLIFLSRLTSSLHISYLSFSVQCNLKAKCKACRRFNLSAVRENTSSSRYRNDISKSAPGSLSVGVRFHSSASPWSALMCLCQGRTSPACRQRDRISGSFAGYYLTAHRRPVRLKVQHSGRGWRSPPTPRCLDNVTGQDSDEPRWRSRTGWL